MRRNSTRTTRHRTRIAASIATACIVFVVLIVPVRSRAQLTPIPLPIVDPVAELQRETQRIQDGLRDSFLFELQLGLANSFQFITQRFAYETAVWLASGGKAQSQLFDSSTAEDFMWDTFLGAGLEFVDDLDQWVGRALEGTNDPDDVWQFKGALGVANWICAPSVPEVSLAIQLGLKERMHPVRPRCTAKDFTDTWKKFLEETTDDPAAALSGIGLTFEAGGSDLSGALALHSGFTEATTDRLLSEENERYVNEKYKGVTDFISGWTKTPASVVEDKLVEDVVRVQSKGMQFTKEEIADFFGDQWHLDTLILQASKGLAVDFAMTLLAQSFQKQIIEGGLFGGPLSLGRAWEESESGSEYRSPQTGRAQAARTVYSDLQRPRFPETGSYDQLALFASCNPENRTVNSCVMDSRFAQVVRQAMSGKAMTVAEALRPNGPLNGTWALIPESDTVNNPDPNCYTKAYCASNLAKLRAARIIPIGWELAANHPKNVGGTKTLQQVVDAFNKNGDVDGKCGTKYALNAAGSWVVNDPTEDDFCGLIDPNWVLLYPDHQCRLRAPTEVLASPGTTLRTEECRDMESCLARDAEGRCVGGYGYCAREKSTWQVSGRSCQPWEASCRAMTSRTGASLSALMNTVDQGICNAENAGCAWYATSWEGNTWDAEGERRYFNHNVAQCTEAAEGCTALLPVATVHRNLIPNPSFERDDDRNGVPDGWVSGGGRNNYYTNTGLAFEGRAEVIVGYNTVNKHVTSERRVPIVGGRTYTLTVHGRRDDDADGRPRLLAILYTGASGTSQVSVAGIAASASCNLQDGDHVGGIGVYPFGLIPAVESMSYSPASCTFIAPMDAAAVEFTLLGQDGSTGLAWMDALQLEEGDRFTGFHEGYVDNAPQTYLKIAPDDFRCNDANPANDHPACNALAKACTAADVGCETYTALGDSADVNATVSALDRCPAECVGYTAYREVDSSFDRKNDFDYFIAREGYATQCALAQAGCASFTNLDAAATGGETRASFTDLRRCYTPDDALAKPATFYTWEGSEETGYQVRQFRLQRATADANAPPEVLDVASGAENCGPNNSADTVDADGGNFYGQPPLLPNGDVNPAYDATITPDCRAFYSQNGTITYRRLSKTVVIDDACTRYRPDHAVNQTLCGTLDGTWQDGQCIFRGLASQSTQCTAEAVGCRAYRGNGSGAPATVLATDFDDTEGDEFDGWEYATGTALNPSNYSSESIIPTGHSLRLASVQKAAHDIDPALPSVLRALNAGGTYEVTLVGKGAGSIRVDISSAAGATLIAETAVGRFADIRDVTLGPSWQQHTIGPLLLTSADAAVLASAQLTIENTGTDRDAYIEEVVLREVPQLTAVIKGSWRVPLSCDRSTADATTAVPQAQGMLGCRAYTYTDRNAQPQSAYVRSFSRLCPADRVGCTAFYDTENSDPLGAEDFPGGVGTTKDDVHVPADTVAYYVDNASVRCTLPEVGCRRFGAPALDRAAAPGGVVDPTAWSDRFFIADPETYERTLCVEEALFCEEYRGSDGTVSYFKNPGSRTCAYRENVLLDSGVEMDGWFQTKADTPTPCYAGHIENGDTFGIWRTGDTGHYDGWVGTCAPEQNQCAELLDPSDVSFAHPDGRPTYVIRNTMDTTTCNAVSSREGCVLLRDVDMPSATVSAAASYAESALQRSTAVPPVDCDRDPAACKRCVEQWHCEGPDGTSTGEVCTTDADCSATPFANCVQGGDVGKRCTAPTDCITGPGPFGAEFTCVDLENDANVLVRANLTRQCTQWYERSGEIPSDDVYTGRTTFLNDSIQLVGESGGSLARPAPSYLTLTTYQKRDRDFGGEEYSGYAIPGTPGLEFLEQVVVDEAAETRMLLPVYCPVGDPRCGSSDGQCVSGTADGKACGPPLPGAPKRCMRPGTLATSSTPSTPPTYGDICTVISQCNRALGESCEEMRGVCYQSRCTYAPRAVEGGGGGLNLLNTAREPLACKAYPENDAPFPRDETFGVLHQDWDITSQETPVFKSGFERVNICMDRGADGGLACECSYQKVAYDGDGTPRYWRSGSDSIPESICVGGVFDGQECNSIHLGKRGDVVSGVAQDTCQLNANPSNADGTCQRIKRNDPAIGVEGYCLERDASVNLYGQAAMHPCQTFYPVDLLKGTPDVNSIVTTAAYQPPAGGQFMCLAAKGNAYNHSGSLASYPTDSRYYVALRAESEYTSTSDMEGKMLFSNDRRSGFHASGYVVGTNSGLEEHVLVNIGAPAYDYADGFSATSSTPLFDRRAFNGPGTLIETKPEWNVWQDRVISYFNDNPNSYPKELAVYDWEIESISFFPSSLTEPEQPLTSPVDFTLKAENEWTACIVKREGDMVANVKYEVADGDECWGSATTQAEIPSKHLFGDEPICKDFEMGDDEYAAYFGISAIFTNHLLQKFYSGYCHETGGSRSAQPYDIFIHFKEYCTDVVRVGSDAPVSGATYRAKPRTDRLWQERSLPGPYQVTDLRYAADTLPAPFGSTLNQNPPVPNTLWLVHPDDIGGKPGFPSTGGEQGGKPYACSDSCINPNISGFTTFPGTPLDGLKKVQELFASIPQWWTWATPTAGGTGPFSYGDVATSNNFNVKKNRAAYWDIAADPSAAGHQTEPPTAPQVFAVGRDIGGGVRERKDEYEGLLTVGSEVGDNESVEVVGSGGRLRTNIEFYFKANKDQMPVRKLTVDAGDGVQKYDVDRGSYANHLDVCRVEDEIVSGVVVGEGDGFGGSPAACVAKPWRYRVTYDCAGKGVLPTCTGGTRPYLRPDPLDPREPNQEKGCWDPTYAPLEGGTDGACVFVPRVVVEDNWGYCTGSCTAAATTRGEGALCFNGSESSLALATASYDPKDDPTVNECLTSRNAAANNPWVEFEGRVIVTPR